MDSPLEQTTANPPRLDTCMTRSGSSSSSILENSAPSGPKKLTSMLCDMVDDATMSKILECQGETLQTLQSTNHSLTKFNDFSAVRYAQCAKNLENHTRLLRDMKGDLDIIFKRIRALRTKVGTQYPTHFADIAKRRQEEEAEDD
ncbi:uncharacterized protein SPPG_00254 [Spizellomyces punctatus DAOM BR117]|uniref:KxDL domain-containing protein n=1 Tax=Spizellomyces punctatus (strain DAOM BR117) TaxID=645134 RepID=A0A0L0HT49_SPIPD|nr:uncharacterized protein SPPG_00254 [Spizellomyces punctatus DAOM BR117]KND04526.1 hypothetical protein SPPG_00254 [Spizellomyces punctatus DAOM BR117]|eukprot:XP_016612565.1 hypothetical protein SPPG_00254 [Spizellomyces punctatus DAOM BR117]